MEGLWPGKTTYGKSQALQGVYHLYIFIIVICFDRGIFHTERDHRERVREFEV